MSRLHLSRRLVWLRCSWGQELGHVGGKHGEMGWTVQHGSREGTRHQIRHLSDIQQFMVYGCLWCGSWTVLLRALCAWAQVKTGDGYMEYLGFDWHETQQLTNAWTVMSQMDTGGGLGMDQHWVWTRIGYPGSQSFHVHTTVVTVVSLMCFERSTEPLAIGQVILIPWHQNSWRMFIPQNGPRSIDPSPRHHGSDDRRLPWAKPAPYSLCHTNVRPHNVFKAKLDQLVAGDMVGLQAHWYVVNVIRFLYSLVYLDIFGSFWIYLVCCYSQPIYPGHL